ncbi:hypothetical protein [Motiliproteus sp. MSK22-1]|uniref:hypothetical protein n=1 Tax=Motiliproteus sp. MSK22-1 TaxID=1897630 RepID=UPI0009768B34|nr:hypothetical protein [Motiliproteus sp. MSK22-1]OMH25803.1 hypothetical protein BGP75_25100 [Motiliproteus sp. MSK22-1]
MKQKITDNGYTYDPEYMILEPILEFLLDNVNAVDTAARWEHHSGGWICVMSYPIDFELIRANFDLPRSIKINEYYGSVDYCLGTAIIRHKTELDPDTGKPVLHG